MARKKKNKKEIKEGIVEYVDLIVDEPKEEEETEVVEEETLPEIEVEITETEVIFEDVEEVAEITETEVVIEEVAEITEEVTPVEDVVEELKIEDDVTYKSMTIKKLFKIIATKEGATYEPYKIYRQKTPITIKGPKGEPTKVTGLMTKIEPMIKLTFTDGTRLRAARKHIVNVNGKNTFMEALSIGTEIDTVTGTKTIKRIDTSARRAVVYDVQVDRKDHLFSDTAGIIHHNTFDITKTLQAEGLSEGKGYKMLKGGGSTAELYATLFKNGKIGKDKKQPILVFDDYDTVLTDDLAVNFLKGALDSGGVRQINYSTKGPEYFAPEDYYLVGDYTDPITGKTHNGDFPDSNNEVFQALVDGCSLQELINAFHEEGWGNYGKNLASDDYADKKTQGKMTKSIVEIAGGKLSNKEKKYVGAYFEGDLEADLKAEIEDLFAVIRISPMIPKGFVFEGLAIFITNLTLDSKLLAPLKSRSAKMEINLNAGELVERIELINKKGGFEDFCEEFNISPSLIGKTIDTFKKKANKDKEDMSGALNVRAFTKALGVVGSDKHIKGDPFAFSDRYFG